MQPPRLLAFNTSLTANRTPPGPQCFTVLLRRHSPGLVADSRTHRLVHTDHKSRSEPERTIESYDSTGGSHTSPKVYTTASSKLWDDAALEEAADTKPKLSRVQELANSLQNQHPNWTGDEEMKDAVLRMLVEKYKPLRSGVVERAEEKIKRSTESASANANAWRPPTSPGSGSWANVPLLPSNSAHNPWDTTYKIPSHDVSAIKLAHIPPSPLSAKGPRSRLLVEDEDAKQRHKVREDMRRSATAGRLTQARESTLDYRLGVKGGERTPSRPNPVSVKGWTSFVEDKIEKARKAGAFNNVKGKGQPLTRTTEEHNPFIAREEFLMNRIVQRNNAAPPWVEMQGELDSSVKTFRSVLRTSWTRRTVLMLTTSSSPSSLESSLLSPERNVALAKIRRMRDSEWLEKERKYFEAAVGNVNKIVRKYNGVAPYVVRKGTMNLEAELNRVYEECAEDILQGVKDAVRGGSVGINVPPLGGGDGNSSGAGGDGGSASASNDGSSPGSASLGFITFLKGVIRRAFGTARN